MIYKEKFISRKFILAVFSTLVCTVALFTSFLSGSEWIAAQSIILGLSYGANAADKKIRQSNTEGE